MQKQANKKKTKKSESKVKNDLMLILTCFAIHTFIFLFVSVASLVIDIETKLVFPVALGCFSLASAASGFYVGRKIRHNGLICGILYALPANVVYLFISLAFNGFKVDYAIAISFALLIVFSAFGGILSVNIKKRTKSKR